MKAERYIQRCRSVNHCLVGAVLGMASFNTLAFVSEEPTAAELIELQLEELVSMEIEVESAGKTQTKAFDLPYAGFVITADDIQKHNILTVPDALRMVPGVQVEQMAGAEWGVSIRGSGGRFSRFVLVLLNGRALNNTIFSGVNWDEMNVPISFIERIEVIRGPNADSWGANAVNGIINIITRNASEITQNKVLLAGNSDSRHTAELLFATDFNNQWDMSIAFNHEQLPGFSSLDEQLNEDVSETSRLNIQFQHESDKSDWSLFLGGHHAEFSSYWSDYNLPEVNPVLALEDKAAVYIQSNWEYRKNEKTTIRTRASADKTDRDSSVYEWNSKNFQLDFDIQYLYGEHMINFGVNLRRSESELFSTPGFPLSMTDSSVDIDYRGFYFSETFNLPDLGLSAKVAARMDHNGLTGYEFQPSARIIWDASEKARVWFAASEAASIPSAGINNAEIGYLDLIDGSEINSPFPLAVVIDQKKQLNNTRVNALEIGFRHLFEKSNIDIALFQFDYTNELEVINQGEPQLSEFPPTLNSYLIQYVGFESTSEYQAKGIEINYLAQLSENWRLQLSASGLDTENITGVERLYSVRTDYQLTDDLQMVFWYRYSSGNEFFEAEDYGVVDFNLNYSITEDLSIRYAAKNYGEGRYEDGRYEEGRREFFSPGVLLNSPSQQLVVSWNF